jgi:formylglycine-generating enzyme required for sulfatase activity
MADLDLDSLFSVQDKPNSKMLEGAGLVFMPDGPRPKLALGLVAALGLLVGLALVEVALLFSGQPELLSQLMGGDQAEQVATPVAPQAALVAESPPPASEQPPTPAAATPSASKMSAVAAPLIKAAPAAAPSAASDALRGGGEGPLMVALPGGSFVMGSKRNTLAKDEQPAHLVDLPPFRISRYEVTFAQYDRFARATGRALPSDAGWGRGERPVINVSWDDAQAYVRWLSQQTGERYRLPSEAQWEYAARAGGESRYWWGFASEQGRAVCFDCGSAWDKRRTAPVGSLPANPFSLHDTAGNAMEWVEDCHHSNYQGAPTNGEAWLNGDCSQRMVRGGAFNKPLSSLRSAARYQLPQDARFNMLGFRVVRD